MDCSARGLQTTWDMSVRAAAVSPRPSKNLPVGQPRGRVLIVDPDASSAKSYERALVRAGFMVDLVGDGLAASGVLAGGRFDVVVAAVDAPKINGIALLRVVRERDLDLPVLLTAAIPSVDTAVKAVEYGAMRYLTKPIDVAELERVVRYAVHFRKMAEIKRQALEHLGSAASAAADLAGLEASFERAFDTMWMAFQPIVRWSSRAVFAYEALMRTTDSVLAVPTALLDAAARLKRLPELGQKVRRLVAAIAPGAPSEPLLFVNLHPQDLLDEALYSPASPLSAHAHRCVLEITERISLDHIPDARTRIGALRLRGYRVAVDDVGAGYAGLASVAQLEPEIIKIDMSLVRNLDQEPLKQRLIGSMVDACGKMGIDVIAEGVEDAGERDALAALGCDLMQGFLFARPGAPFPQLAT